MIIRPARAASRRRRSARVVAVAGGLAALAFGAGRAAVAAASVIIVDNADDPGEGFNDPTPFTPTGGNPATTLGQARLGVFQFAATSWANRLSSRVPIHVSAQFNALTCDAQSALLGSAGATTIHRDFPSAPVAATWYAQALANAIAGVDLDPSSPDISAQFSSSLDGGTCLGGARWYYGFDGKPPSGRIDLATIVLHELAHGLGFQAYVNLATGAKFMGGDDAYMRNLEQHGANPSAYPAMSDAERVAASTSDPNLQWTGADVDTPAAAILTAGIANGHVRIYAPATQAPGSSVSHFSTDVAPNELMEPFYTGPDHDLTLTFDLLRDLGWSAAFADVPALSAGGRGLLAVAFAAAATLALALGRRARR